MNEHYVFDAHADVDHRRHGTNAWEQKTLNTAKEETRN